MRCIERMSETENRAHGAYDHFSWRIYSGPRAIALDSTAASLHELFHSELDQSTDFGTALCCVAQVVRACADADRPSFQRLLTRLLMVCQTTHEAYATYMSSLLLAEPGPSEPPPNVALGAYKRFWQVGVSLTNGLTSRFLRFHTAMTAVKLAMQAPICERILTLGLDQFSSRDVARVYWPDERLRHLEGFVRTPGFWRKVLGAIEEAHPHPDWPRVWEAERNDEKFQELLGNQDDGISSLLFHQIHLILAAELRRLGHPSLEPDGHTKFAGPMYRAVKHLLPGYPLSLKLSADLLPEAGVAQYVEMERLFIRAPRRAALFTVEELITGTWLNALNGDQEAVVFVRWPGRLAEQFSFFDIDAARLAQQRSPLAFVPMIASDEGGPVVCLFVIETPDELLRIQEKVSVRLLSSISAAAIEDEAWMGLWHEMLSSTTTFALLDVAPFALLLKWLEFGLPFRHGRIEFQLSAKSHEVVWFEEPSRKQLWFTPVTTSTSLTLLSFLGKAQEKRGLKMEEESTLSAAEVELMRPMITQILTFESWFDFRAGVGNALRE